MSELSLEERHANLRRQYERDQLASEQALRRCETEANHLRAKVAALRAEVYDLKGRLGYPDFAR